MKEDDDNDQCGHPCEDYFAQYGECACTVYGSWAASPAARATPTASPLADTYHCPTCDAPLGDLVVRREIADAAEMRALHYEQSQGDLRMRLMDAEGEARHLRAAIGSALDTLTKEPSLGHSLVDCDGEAWDAAETLRSALGTTAAGGVPQK